MDPNQESGQLLLPAAGITKLFQRNISLESKLYGTYVFGNLRVCY